MDQILGQSRAIDLLQSALGSGRLHHAYIFHGPEGVGKFTTALRFARVLLCHEPQRDLTGKVVACESCSACRRFHVESPDPDADRPPEAMHSHPDLHIVTKELARYSAERTVRERKLTTIPVQVLRDTLLEPVYRGSRLGGRKVFLVDEAHLLDLRGQNLLLKTLEEPPEGTFLVLVTANEDRLLPTIRSRCQRIAFVPLPDEVVRRWLDERAPQLEAAPRRWLVHFAAGSLGQAELALKYDLFEWANEVLPAVDRMAEGVYPADLGSRMSAMIGGFAEAWVKGHANASKEAANKQAAGLMWKMIAQHARARLATLTEACEPSDPVECEARLEPWLGVIDALHEAERELQANVNLNLLCDHTASLMHRSLARLSLAGR